MQASRAVEEDLEEKDKWENQDPAEDQARRAIVVFLEPLDFQVITFQFHNFV